MYSRGLLVVIGNVDNVDGLSLRALLDAINSDVCMRFVISPSVNGAIVVWIVSTLDNGNDVDDDDDDDDDDVNDDDDGGEVDDAAATAAAAATVSIACVFAVVSLINASFIDDTTPLLPLSRVNDNDDNDGTTTCSALSSLCIVFDTTNSFIVPL